MPGGSRARAAGLALLCAAAGNGTEGAGTGAQATSHAPRAARSGTAGEVRLITLDPGHFHAALVQKSMYDRVDPVVHVFAPEGSDVELHLARIDAYNTRPEAPTAWRQRVYTGRDYLERLLAVRPGNVVVLSGNNRRKIDYIRAAVAADLHVFADKPMIIRPADFPALEAAYRDARNRGVLLYDIMTERYEITSILQRELAATPAVFGELLPGSADDPAVTKHSVHHFSKQVSGAPLRRPAWFFDVRQQGEGMVDVATHLVDLVHWQCFPDRALAYPGDLEVLAARRWPTELTPAQFEAVTGEPRFSDALAPDVMNGVLRVYSNGEIRYVVNGIHAHVSVEWRYQAPPGATDTHHSLLRGSRARLVVRQGEAEGYRPTLYVEPSPGTEAEALEAVLVAAVARLAQDHPGLEVEPAAAGWQVVVPDALRVGHEAHFAQVTEQYLRYLADGAVPDWEIQNTLARYYVTTEAYRLSRPSTPEE